MLNKSNKKNKAPLKKPEEFTKKDIDNIIQYGRDKYTVNEISNELRLSKKGVTAVLDQYKITVPKKPNNIQRLYEQGKLNTNQFYIEASSLIKSRLMPDLIYKGYFRDGQRQISYNLEDVEDCYTYVLEKIIKKYDPTKGTLATFIRTWTRGYGTTITTAQHRRYNKVGNDSSLDETYNSTISEEFRDTFSFHELEESIDRDYFGEDIRYGRLIERDMERLKKVMFKTVLKGLTD